MIPTIRLNKCAGLPFVEEILNKIEEVSRGIDHGRNHHADSAQTIAEVKGSNPVWCPCCGDFGVLNAIYKAIVTMELT